MKPTELEQRLLSSVRDVDDLLLCHREGISEESFNDADLKPVWTYIEKSIRENGEVVDSDLQTLFEFDRGERGDIATFIKLVRDEEIRSKARQAIASKLNNLDSENPVKPIGEIISGLREVQAGGMRKSVYVDADATERLRFYTDLVAEVKAGELGIKTGLKSFDNEGLGWRKGELIIVLGPTGCGKSWLITYFAANAYHAGKRVLFISPEMTKEEAAFRFDPIYATMINEKSTLSNKALSTGTQDVERYKKFIEIAYIKSGRHDLSIVDASEAGRQLSYDEIWNQALEFQPDVLVIDGLHLITGAGKEHKGWEVLKEGVEYLKALAQQQDIVVIAAHQPDRSAQRKSSGPPQLSQIGYGFSVAQSANRVISLGFVESSGFKRCYIVPKMRGFQEIRRERYLNWDVDTGKIWEEDSADDKDMFYEEYRREE